ncbi:MAG: T9SS type B sorting domain-containing protein [Saprospiraceae bacterium]|nr:T9SS type B sorting domain-containing protein [Saprospiraceae bacterium]
MKNIATTFIWAFSLFFVSKTVIGQTTITMRNGSVSTGTCGAVFYDSGGNAGAYSNNQDLTFTICSDDPMNNHIALGFNDIDIAAGDELCFFDGSDTNAPSLGCASDFANNPNLVVETSARNGTGCMTIRFRSNSSGTGRGWFANVVCIPSCQTFTTKIVSSRPAIVPVDTGWIDACPNTTSINFKASGSYPLNNVAYRQSDSLSKFEWNFDDGTPVAYGPDVNHIFTKSGGYVVKLTVIDTHGCKNINYIKQRVRIAPRPTFNLGSIVSQICAGQEVRLRGTTAQIDPNYNVSTKTNEDSFRIGQVRSEKLFIPDNQRDQYKSSVYFTDFNPGQTLQNAADLKRIFVNMEHSWARDLEIKIVCPSQQSAILHKYAGQTGNEIRIGLPRSNRYTPGSDGTGTQQNDPAFNPAGTGLEYGWTSLATRTWRSFTSGAISLAPGDYAPEDPFTRLVGCPLNGEWSLYIKDQWTGDNGWIFYWGIDFEKRLYPKIETFKPQIVSHTWLMNPTVTSYNMDSIVARPRNAGIASYTYQVKDNFNCVWDTAVNVNILPPTNAQCAVCDLNFPELKDTSFCVAEPLGTVLNKTSLNRVNNSVTFDAFPNVQIDGNTATLFNPHSSTILVRNIFMQTLTDPLTQLDSVCIDVNSSVADDYVVQLKAPSGQTILMKPDRVGGVQKNIRALCFSPTATRAIESAASPLTGDYQPAGGVTTWNTLRGATVNGNWQLLSSVIRGGHTDTLTHWSITFKSGNALKYSWAPATGLSCSNCATPTARPTNTTQYIVTVVDSLNCTHRDTVRVTVIDSLAAPSLSVGNLNFSWIQFVWGAVNGATGYEVSVDSGRTWVTPNGNLQHTVTGLRTMQTVTLMVRALGGTCGARIARLSETSMDCIATIGRGANRRLLVDSILCYGGTSPFVNFAFANGVQPLTYKIDTFSQLLDPVFRNKIKAGRHTAIVIDGEGCQDTLIFYLGQPDPLSIQKTVDSVKCNNTATGKISLVASGGVGRYVYTLNLSPFGRNPGVFDSLVVGKYIIEVEDSNRCRFRDSATIYQPSALTMNLVKQDVRCFGNTNGSIRALAAGGISPYSYSWSNGNTTSVLTNLTAGKYVVTLTDKNGCRKTDSSTVVSPAKIVITPVQDSVKCFGDATGRARARVTGGLTPYSYNWNNTQFDSIASGLKAGLQRVTVTDGIGCSDTASITVLQPAQIRFDSLVSMPATCSNLATGSARVVVSGGVQPYRYTWLPNGATTPSISNLPAARYGITVRDNNNCFKTDSVTVSSNPALVIQGMDFSQLKCNGDATGSIVVKATGGTGVYTYRWSTSPMQTADTAKNLTAGRYSVTVTDQNNCTVTKDTTLSEPPRLNATITQFKNVKCKGDANGTATPSVTGGTPFQSNFRYIYKWSDPRGQDAVTAVNLGVGTYTVSVTDANGCVDTANITITEPATAVQAFPVQTKLSCYNGSTGEAQVSATGGSGNYSYRWSNLQNTQTVTGLSRQFYSVTVTDASGCQAIDSIAIQSHDSIKAQIAVVQPRCYNTSTGSLSISSVEGGAGNGNVNNYFYRWNTNPAQTNYQAVNIPGGRTYSVTVTDTEGCTNTFFKFIGQPGPILLSAFSKPVSCFGGSDGQALITAVGSNNSFTYKWNDTAGQTTQQATKLIAGRYAVTITDSTGCKRDTVVDVFQPSRLKIDSKTITDNKCVGDTTGRIDLTVSGGIPFYNISWSSGDTSASAKKLRSGTYIVTISDANGCKLFDTIVVKSPPVLDADISANPVKCFGDQNGSIIVDAFGGTQPYYYSLNGKTYNGISQIVGVKAGSYDVYVKDANGCIWFDNVTIASPPKFIVEASPDITINLGDKTQLFANPLNNRGTVTLTWKQPYDSTLSCLKCPNPIAKPMSTILYIVNGVDSAGCRASDSVKITVSKPRNVLVPTGFTPNEDLINDKLIVRGRTGTIIKVFRIYDRWGEMLYEATNFQINDEKSGWDGTFRGQYMNSGQYVWYVEAQYIDGATEILKGHTTLIR